MQHADKKHEMDVLTDYLDREKEALLAGDLELLARLLTEKERLVESLASRSLTLDEMEQVRTKFAANNAMFEGALAGIREVARKLGDVRRSRANLLAYNQRGEKCVLVESRRSSVEKRA